VQSEVGGQEPDNLHHDPKCSCPGCLQDAEADSAAADYSSLSARELITKVSVFVA